MLSNEEYELAHKSFPRLPKYRNKPSECQHDFRFIIYCNGKTDIVRCPKCGLEKEVPCSVVNDEYV